MSSKIYTGSILSELIHDKKRVRIVLFDSSRRITFEENEQHWNKISEQNRIRGFCKENKRKEVKMNNDEGPQVTLRNEAVSGSKGSK